MFFEKILWSFQGFISVPCHPSGRRGIPSGRSSVSNICPDNEIIPSGRPSVHYSIRSDDVSSRPDARQTSIIRPETILYREVFVPACIRPDVSAACPDASQYSISFWFLSKFQEREDQSTVRKMWYPVLTRASIRQESQFKYDRSDIW
jgi:hypothetical protein